MNYEDFIFEDDLQFVADRVTAALNIFNETVVMDNKMITAYGNDEYIALLLSPYSDNPEWGRLRLRTRDMAATWDNVPVGFAKFNESRGLFNDMRKAAKVSLKRNSIWYIDRQIKDIVGDRIVFTELTTNKGYFYKVAFTNGFVSYLSIAKDDKEYYRPHDVAQLYLLAKKDKTTIGAPMTADECIMMLANIAMQTDKRVSEFINVAQQSGGKTLISHSYRTAESSVDEVRAVFPNGYALKLKIQNEQVLVDIFARYNMKTYLLDSLEFKNIEDVYATAKEFSVLPKYEIEED